MLRIAVLDDQQEYIEKIKIITKKTMFKLGYQYSIQDYICSEQLLDDLEDNKYDLILAGHSHNGQINIPLVKDFLIPEGAVKYSNGHYKLENSDLYVSNGIGVSDVNFRLFNTPSIDVYRLVK